MSKNKVSVLVPVYGVENYIERCVHSLFSQTFVPIEFIFVDDCSIDNSIQKLNSIITLYPNRQDSIRIIKSEKNRGVGASRQTAIDAATGDYILFVDSDDYIETKMVELLYNKAIDTSADMVFCQFYSEYKNGEFKVNSPIFSNDKIELINDCFNSFSAFWNKLIRREIIVKNEMKLLESVNYGEDLAFVPKIIYLSDKFAFVQKPLYHYIQYNVNAYTKIFSDKSLADTLKVTSTLDDFFSKKVDASKYKKSLTMLKAVRKAKILRSGRLEKQYVELFPEINAEIIKMNLDFKTKIILLLAALEQYIALKFFVNILLKKAHKK